MSNTGQHADNTGTTLKTALFSGSFSTVSGRRLRALGLSLLVVGIPCFLCAVAFLVVRLQCDSNLITSCGYYLNCYSYDTFDRGSVSCIILPLLFVMAGSLAVAASRRRNRCLLLTVVLFSTLAAMGAVGVIAVGGGKLLPSVKSELAREPPLDPKEMRAQDRFWNSDECQGEEMQSSVYRTATNIWEKNRLLIYCCLTLAVATMALALAALIISLWCVIHVCRATFSTATCRAICPRCWAWCFDKLADDTAAVALQDCTPAPPLVAEDKRQLADSMVTEDDGVSA